MRISGVDKNSIGEELGLKAGDEVVSFDGYKAVDILDYEFYDSSENFTLGVKRGEEETLFDIEKDPDESLGLEFDREIPIRECKNNCIFCFVHQLPENEPLRDTLRVRDDDYRHSFISGNYVTLTNLSDFDVERIIRLKLSPLYVSVHTVDDDLRNVMLGIKRSRPILPLLKKFYDAGIVLHTQIVYCPGINEDLERSITELSEICATLAIVPVGLTKNANPRLRPVNRSEAERVIALTEKYQDKLLKEKGTRFVWASDEFYIKAERPVPGGETYEDYPQIENGVGLLAKFEEDFAFALKTAKKCKNKVSVATGVSAYGFIKSHAEILNEKLGCDIRVYKIENSFFGSTVTVAGLVVGRDIYGTLKGKDLGERLIIPSVMLREFRDVFLDNMTVKELGEKLNVKITVADSTGDGFVYAVTDKG